VTVCTFRRECLFEDEEFEAIAENVWLSVTDGSGALDLFVVVPNHVHGIIWITERGAVGAQQPLIRVGNAEGVRRSFRQRPGRLLRPYNVSPSHPARWRAVVRAFKAASSKRINNLRGTPGMPVWQRGYYEHVVRGEGELERIRQYIVDNPRNWAGDLDNPGKS